MPSHPIDFQINSDVFSTPELRHIFEEKTIIQRWLDFEAALATAQARLGIIPQEAALVIGDNARLECLDMDAVREGYTRSRNSVIPVLSALRKACGSAGEYVHFGATTQDVLDTALVLGVRQAMGIIQRDCMAIETCLLDLAEEHAATPMVGRTHGQQALPVTFGLKVAIWAGEMSRNMERLDKAVSGLRYGQLGGAAGTMAALGPKAFEVAQETLAILGLEHDPASWHTSRDSMAEVAMVLSILSMTLAKIANEIFQLQKTETGELSEPPPGGAASSSTMPHKQNPVICQRVVALSRHIRPLAMTVVESMGHEHERDPRCLWSEWLAMPQLCIYAGTCASYMKDVLSGLAVHKDRMYRNLCSHGDMVTSEWLMFRLIESMGRVSAQKKVRELAARATEQGVGLKEVVLADPDTGGLFTADDLEPLERPELYTGHAQAIVNRVLEDIRGRRGIERGEAQ